MTMRVAEMVATLASSDSLVYVLSNEDRIVRTNSAWETFALENGGEAILSRWSRGASIHDALPECLRPFYRAAFARARETGEVWHHDYECSAPALLRRFRMTVYPVDAGFLVIANALLVEVPYPEAGHPADPTEYEVEGLLTICAHCRKTRHPGFAERWDWVPSYIDGPRGNVSHGLCDACRVYHYGLPEGE